MGRRFDPFPNPRKCRAGGIRKVLKRALTDLLPRPLPGAAARLTEHYGIEVPEVPVSAVRETTEEHGAQMLAQEQPKSDWPDRPGAAVLIVEMDGSMLPVVEVAEPGPGEAELDRRNTRRVSWKEGRLALAHEALQPFLTPDQIPDPQAPVRACFRYIPNHSQFLDYQGGPSGRLAHRLGRD